MSKPLVILMPGKEREALRDGGALPPSFFKPGSGVSLWPRDIDYSRGPEIAKTIADRPGDVPVFFGFPESGNPHEIDERTAEIVSVLNSTMVHVVFLDDATPSGKIEYGHFSSFKPIIEWGRSLVKVLRTRFVNEVDLHRLENVLVVVCRGQQIKIGDDECGEFSGLVGENANDTPLEELKPFVSCYFLNRELSIDGKGEDIYSSSVWDILVGRLLKAFVFSREQHQLGGNAANAIWMRPGIRIWKAEECFMDQVETLVSRTMETTLSRITQELREFEGGGEDGRLLSPPCPGYPRGEVQCDKLIDYQGRWNRFDSAALAKQVENPETRKAAIEAGAKSYFDWRLENERPDEEELHRVFSDVKEDPERLFARSREVDRTLAANPGLDNEARAFEKLVGDMTAEDKRHKGLAGELATMSADLSLAQQHYVTWWKGLFVFAAVTAMCGATLWQVVTLLGGGLPAVLILLAAAAAGSFVSVLGVVAVHDYVGYSAAEAFTDKCKELDESIVRKHNLSREILCKATETLLNSRRRNLRLRLFDLLARIRDVLVRELRFRPAQANVPTARALPGMPAVAGKQREKYLGLTAGTVAQVAENVRIDAVVTAMLAQWRQAPNESFGELWSRFCERNDIRNAGYLPVSAFIPKMREFMARFLLDLRRRVRTEVDRLCAVPIQHELRAWCTKTDNVLFYSGKAAVNARASAQPRQVFIAVAREPGVGRAAGEALIQEVRNANYTVSSEFHKSDAMVDIEGSPVALAIHEVDVEIGSDTEAGVIALRQRSRSRPGEVG